MPVSNKIQTSRFESYMGGSTRRNKWGYVTEYVGANHPLAYKSGYALQHVLVMVDWLGTDLPEGAEIHHIDGDPTNNRIDNLALTTQKGHKAFHRPGNTAVLSAEEVKKALKGRTIAEAATHLGVNHQTLRNRFPHLLDCRKSPTRESKHTKSILEQYAADPDLGFRDLAAKYGISAPYAKKLLEKYKMRWNYRHPSGRVKTKIYG